MILAGDIGGTKSCLALFRKGAFHPLEMRTFPSASYDSLLEVVQEFRQTLSCQEPIEIASFAVAGPVLHQRCQTTNLPWFLDAELLAKELAIPFVFLINDLEAAATALPILEKRELVLLRKGGEGRGHRGILSPGTGLGEAGIYWDGEEYHPFACEGGHTSFGPRNEEELRLCRYLLDRFGHASYERILSGPGLETLYAFLEGEEEEGMPLPGQGRAKVITQRALEGSSARCVESVRLFFSILGDECGNAALKFFALGGLFLGGGILPLLHPFFQKSWFFDRFYDKGRMRGLMEQIPLYLIVGEAAAVKGAARYAQGRREFVERG